MGMIKRLIFLFLVLFLYTPSYAVTAWVDNNGAAAWGACQGAPKSGVAACSLSTANANASASDLINMRTGAYTTSIEPSNSGSSGNPITYIAYNSEVVTITGVYNGADLLTKSYITVDGIRIVDVTHWWVDMKNTSYIDTHITIQNCYMEGAGAYGGINIRRSDYNKILNNELVGTCSRTEETKCDADCGGPNNLIAMRYSDYNIIQGNVISDAPHIGISIFTGYYNVIKDNIISNPWHTTFAFVETGSSPGSESINLIEGNTFLDAGEDATINWCGSIRDRDDFLRWQHSGLQLQSKENIVRHNVLVNCGTMNMETYSPSNRYCLNNRVYNNTFYQNYRTISDVSSEDATGNILKNNIIYGSREYALWYNTISDDGFTYDNNNIDTPRKFGGVYINNLDSVNPLFTDPDNRDLSLQDGSPMIDAGTWLTYTNGSGSNSMTLIVDDARYFMDGWGIITGDEIQLAGQGTTATITDITGNVMTIDTALTWNNNVGVSLIYNGTSPDIGASETSGGHPDTDPPVISDITPAVQLCAATAELRITTNEDATCRWGLSDLAYASMGNTFNPTGLRSHTQTLSVECGTAYGTFYARCIDGSGNANTSSTEINFTVEPEPGTSINAITIGEPGNEYSLRINDKALTVGGE